jgi:hypothetical protein
MPQVRRRSGNGIGAKHVTRESRVAGFGVEQAFREGAAPTPGIPAQAAPPVVDDIERDENPYGAARISAAPLTASTPATMRNSI